MEFIKINTPRLHIRNLKLSDLQDFYVYRSNPDVTKYQGFDVLTLDQCKAFIQQEYPKQYGKPGQWVQYAIEEVANNKLIGDCAIRLYEHEPRIATIGITISHLEQQKGFAKEAMLGILSFLFNEKQLHRVEEIIDVENKASIALIESLGFRKEAHFIENIFFKGSWGSEYQYAMLKTEWDKRN
ncbi:GNAT family N-acetyltransferase [Neptunitalea lumnitzerae]|uniref:Ribosomal-protein-serine acetyltransferase n=1 Tax=Neptunitalea lumnitzerae TaxID=2965509 RepID=A0ABQ5MFS3_9FLAO|nr:GNAT family N-acetyltransferase [Neptunitalea sp. Y10]GLB48228.1 ribosomal-protein-serine acetyltransferase [Neptunitalea sp. Y10]